MSYSNNNPFVRGYDGLSVQRLLAISYDDDCPLTYLPLHPSQSNLPDSQIERRSCVFSDDFALITEDQAVPAELEAECRSHGEARTVVYAALAGKPLPQIALDEVIDLGLLACDGDRICTTDRGVMMLNGILRALLADRRSAD